jgi:hypothetical protein
MDGVTINEVPAEAPNPLKVPEPKLEEKKELTPEEKMVESLKAYSSFLKFENGVLSVTHDELKALLKPKILKMGDLVKRGNIITNLNGGVAKPDEQTAFLNSCLATVSVGFESFTLDLLNVVDSDLIIGLYIVVRDYNTFFRSTPLSFIL